MPSSLVIGLVAGLVVLAALAAGSLAGLLFLFLLVSLLVAVAGLGWGWQAGAGAAVLATFIVTVAGPPQTWLLYAVGLGVPIVHLAYQVLLNRTVPAAGPPLLPAVEWYPIGRIVAIAALWAGALAAVRMATIATDIDGLRAAFRPVVEEFARRLAASRLPQGETLPLGAKDIGDIVEIVVAGFAGLIASTWMVLVLAVLWLAARMVLRMQRLVRPWPDLTSLVLPRGLSLLFAGFLALTFMPGYVGLLASGFVSPFLIAYSLVGLAILHTMTRGYAFRPFVLLGAYVVAVFMPPLTALIGLAEPFLSLRRRPPGRRDPS